MKVLILELLWPLCLSIITYRARYFALANQHTKAVFSKQQCLLLAGVLGYLSF